MAYHSITEGQVVMLKSRAEELGITLLESLEELEDLGLTCGTQIGTTQEDELSKVVPGVLRTYADFILALEDMKRGEIDCIYSETPITSWWMLEAEERGEEPIVVIYKKSYWPVSFVVHMDNDILVAKMNGALAEIIVEGKLDELKAEWKC
jgi:ABC-type amino acid transport substrate-binding protein